MDYFAGHEVGDLVAGEAQQFAKAVIVVLFGCGEYYQVHVSGHAPAAGIRGIVEEAMPDFVVPIHTRYSEAFGAWRDPVVSTVKLGEHVI